MTGPHRKKAIRNATEEKYQYTSCSLIKGMDQSGSTFFDGILLRILKNVVQSRKEAKILRENCIQREQKKYCRTVKKNMYYLGN